MDDFTKHSNDSMTVLANLNAWQEMQDHLDDDLARDEKLVRITETSIDENQQDHLEEDEGVENISIPESQPFDFEDMLSVAAE